MKGQTSQRNFEIKRKKLHETTEMVRREQKQEKEKMTKSAIKRQRKKPPETV